MDQVIVSKKEKKKEKKKNSSPSKLKKYDYYTIIHFKLSLFLLFVQVMYIFHAHISYDEPRACATNK